MDQETFNLVSVALVGAQLIVLAAAAGYAFVQAREARRLREQQFRPFVVVDVEVDNSRILEIVVRNVGLTMARDVKFEIDPAFATSMDDYDLNSMKLFSAGIATLPPGKEYRTLFDSLVQRSHMNIEREYTVTVTYSDPTGTRQFSEPSTIDLGIYHDFLYRNETDLGDAVDELKKIGKTLNKWTFSLGGIKTLSPDEARAESDRFEEAYSAPPTPKTETSAPSEAE